MRMHQAYPVVGGYPRQLGRAERLFIEVDRLACALVGDRDMRGQSRRRDWIVLPLSSFWGTGLSWVCPGFDIPLSSPATPSTAEIGPSGSRKRVASGQNVSRRVELDGG